MAFLRRIFWFLNKFFMVPVFRLGLGPLVGNPVTGYIMVLKTTGRKTGRLRYTPVNYAILDGYVYCLAGFGKRTHWYLNLQANPKIEVILPSGAYVGQAEAVTDEEEALKAVKQVLKNAGFAAIFEGYNPYRASDEKFKKTLVHAPVVRLKFKGLGSGPYDQGGWVWLLWVFAILILLFLLILK